MILYNGILWDITTLHNRGLPKVIPNYPKIPAKLGHYTTLNTIQPVGTKCPPCKVALPHLPFRKSDYFFFLWQTKVSIPSPKKTGIHLREIQSIIRSRWTPNIQLSGWL